MADQNRIGKMVVYKGHFTWGRHFYTEPPLKGLENGTIETPQRTGHYVSRALDAGYSVEINTEVRTIDGVKIHPLSDGDAERVRDAIKRHNPE